MKKAIITTFLTSAVMLLISGGFHSLYNRSPLLRSMKVGFVYENDESTSYTYNFVLAQEELEEKYGDRVKVMVRNNVAEDQAEEPLREMAQSGCRLVFINSYSRQVKEIAREYPQVQFCQVSYTDNSQEDLPANYHTFKGEAYQGRYISGMIAGLKLEEMIHNQVITEEEALAGFIAAYPTTEVISGFTAFLLGIRSVIPQARMEVIYTHTWSNYSLEKEATQKLIQDGCLMISQHTDTIAPAVACEEYDGTPAVYHIGYNQSMLDFAPTAALVSTRINWTVYVLAAAKAVFEGTSIEKESGGIIHGQNDVSGGIDRGWVEIMDLNQYLLPEKTTQEIAKAVEMLRKGEITVFKGDYIGVNPEDPSDTYDLRAGYEENRNSSSPTFHYLLQDVIKVVDSTTGYNS